jgi:spermidine synthase
MPIKNYRWLIEAIGPEEGHLHGIRNFLFSGQTKFQSLDLLELGSYGKALVLDGRIQSTAADEFIYHEALVHPAMLAHPHPQQVFVVGGGEGATLREVLRHRSVKRVLMVDIDAEVVSRCRELLPELHQGSFEDPRAELAFIDARKYLEETAETFDVILIDISEPVQEGPAYLLFTREFYEVVRDRLNRPGMIALQAGSVGCVGAECFAAVHKTLRSVFPSVSGFAVFVPSYGVPWGFCMASSEAGFNPLSWKGIDELIAARIQGELRFYDSLTHQGIFSLPKHVRVSLAQEQRIIEDNAPFFTFH